MWALGSLTLGRALSFSSLGWACSWSDAVGSWRLQPCTPPLPPPSPLAELTLDKQLQSIYLGPYGAGEQVCGNEEPSSN